MVSFALIFGADKDRAEKEMKEALDFELKLIKVNKCRTCKFVVLRIDLLFMFIAILINRFHWHVKNVEMILHCTIHIQ